MHSRHQGHAYHHHLQGVQGLSGFGANATLDFRRGDPAIELGQRHRLRIKHFCSWGVVMQPIGWRQLKSTFSTALWAVPILAIPFAMIATRALHWLDAKTERNLLGFGVPGAQTMLQAVVTAALFLVFTSHSWCLRLPLCSWQFRSRADN